MAGFIALPSMGGGITELQQGMTWYEVMDYYFKNQDRFVIYEEIINGYTSVVKDIIGKGFLLEFSIPIFNSATYKMEINKDNQNLKIATISLEKLNDKIKTYMYYGGTDILNTENFSISNHVFIYSNKEIISSRNTTIYYYYPLIFNERIQLMTTSNSSITNINMYVKYALLK